jgi:hypothetical protein
VKMADEAVRIGPPPVKDSYLNVPEILLAATRTGARAIHPGYGLLSEKGPSPRPSARRASSSSAPPPPCSTPSATRSRRAPWRAPRASSPSRHRRAHRSGRRGGRRGEAERIGFPLLVKAAGGGGGIGMQIVARPEQARARRDRVLRPRKSAFADPRVYMEKYIRNPKHIEVQVLCDAHGQRRRARRARVQRAAPAPEDRRGVPLRGAVLRGPGRRRAPSKALGGRAAHRAARRLHGRGHGRVRGGRGRGALLPRGQRAPAGRALRDRDGDGDRPRGAADPRRLGRAPSPPILAPRGVGRALGHSIEARVYAEDPAKKFAPQPGHLAKVDVARGGPDLRIETGVAEGLDVTPFYDPMIAKVVAHGADAGGRDRAPRSRARRDDDRARGARGPVADQPRVLAQDPRLEPLSGTARTTRLRRGARKARRRERRRSVASFRRDRSRAVGAEFRGA